MNSVNLQSGDDTPAPSSPPLVAGRAFPGSVRIPGSFPEEPTKEDNQATRQNQKGESEKERKGEKEQMEANGMKPVFFRKRGKK